MGSLAMRQTLAALAGGAAGALAGGLAIRAGLKTDTVALGLVLGGGVAAITATGLTRYAAGGVAAAGAGQVALLWLEKQPAKRQGIIDTHIDTDLLDRALGEARNELHVVDDAADHIDADYSDIAA